LFFGGIKSYKSGGDEDKYLEKANSESSAVWVVGASAIARMTLLGKASFSSLSLNKFHNVGQ